MQQKLSAVVLVAGRSTRMGRDKALLEVGGRPLWERQRGVLVDSGASEVFLSARPDQAWTRQAAGFAGLLHDALPGCGPLVGITAALERARHPWVAVLAVDLPAITPAWFRELAQHATVGRGVIGRRDAFFEPLAAVYPRELRWLAGEALARNDYALQPLMAEAVRQGLLRVREIGPAEEPMFVNWNSEADRR